MIPGGQSKFLGALAKSPRTFSRQIDYIAERLADKRVVELERLGTALYVTLDNGTDREDRAKEIVRLKPHVDPTDARSAVGQLDEIIAEVKARGLTLRTRTAGSA